MSIKKLILSFRFAFRGLFHAIRTEQNMRVHLVASVVAIAAGLFFRIAMLEWMAIVGCIGAVISLECLNTALERMADRITKEHDPMIGQAKDLSAAAVLIAALVSIVVAGMIFGPRLLNFG